MSWTPERKEQALAMWREGMSASQIAQTIGGVSRSAVIGVIHRMGAVGRAVLSKPARPARKAARPRSLPAAPKPALTVKANKQVFEAPEARPPRALTGDEAFCTPLPGSAPRPFWDRKLEECRWPIGTGTDLRCCCEPATRDGYCEPHAQRAFNPKPKATANELMRSLRRHA